MCYFFHFQLKFLKLDSTIFELQNYKLKKLILIFFLVIIYFVIYYIRLVKNYLKIFTMPIQNIKKKKITKCLNFSKENKKLQNKLNNTNKNIFDKKKKSSFF